MTLGRGEPRDELWSEDATLEAVRRQLTHAVNRLCPEWLSSHRDDIIQAALIRVHKLLAGEKRTDFQSSYLWKVAFSVIVDEIRRHRRRAEDTLDTAGTMDLTHATPGPEERAIARESRQAIQSCLAGLGEARRLAVTLHLQGHTVPEASRFLGWSVKRVANLTYRGLDDLRRCLAAKGYQG